MYIILILKRSLPLGFHLYT